MRDSSIDEIRTDAFNLSDDVAFPGQCHCDHENDAAAADDDAKHRQCSAEFVRAQRLKSKMPGLVPVFGFVSYVGHGSDFSLARTKSRELFRFLQVFQPRFRFLASRIELQSSAVLFGRFGAFALSLVETPEPLARGSMRRPIAAVGRAGEVGLQILFGMRRINRRKHSIHAAIVSQARIVGIYGRGSVNSGLQIRGLILLYVVFGCVEIGFHGLGLRGKGLLVFAFGGIVFLGYLGLVKGSREMPLDRIDRSDRFHLGFGFVLIAADNPRGVNIEFLEVTAGRDVRRVCGNGVFKLLLHFLGKEKTALAVGFSAIGAAEPQMVIGVLGIEPDGFFAIGDGIVVVMQFVIAAAEPVSEFGVIRIRDHCHLQCGNSARKVSGIVLAYGVLERGGSVRRKAGCHGAAACCKWNEKKHCDRDCPQQLVSAVHYILASVARTSMPSFNTCMSPGSTTLSPSCRPLITSYFCALAIPTVMSRRWILSPL